MLMSTSSKHTRHALLIEDDEVDQLTLTRALQKSATPYTLDTVNHLTKAKPLLRSKQYDVIITDMNLPDSDGLDTIEMLLSIALKTPIVVLSDTNNESMALEAVQYGAQDFISKDYINDSRLINQTVAHAIERHQLKRNLESTRDREYFLAHHDQLTKLPNRLLLIDRLNQAILQAQRSKEQFTLCFIDLDRFKSINDSLGHTAGDEVLRYSAERMKKLLRESDTIARFGGDEFVLILRNTHTRHDLNLTINKIITTLNVPIPFRHHCCQVGASIGAASFPDHGQTVEQLLQHADMAMYEAKESGRNQFVMFSDILLERRNFSLNQEKSLKQAIKNADDNFKLFFQPRISMQTNKIESVEALIRWNHPTLGEIPPDQFIPLAESMDLIEQIDQWVFAAACRQIIKWRPIDPTIRISINVSAQSFNKPNFTAYMIQILGKYGINGHNLEIEITEGVLLDNADYVREQLKDLKRLGIKIAIDDFGTGFSSLSYLSQLPIDTLKIDGSFMCDENSNHHEKSLLKAIINLGQTLGLTVVAECVETKSQEEYLRKLNCTEGQGFYWSQPCNSWEPRRRYH